MSIMNALMPRIANPAVQAAENRTLGMSPTVAPTAVMAPGQPAGATSTGDPTAAAAAAPGEAGAQATMGAEAVQPTPPQPAKIVLGSVVRGAVTGASMMFGINSFGAKIPFVANIMTKALKFVPFLKLGFPMGTVAALGVGAAVGAIFGLVGGLRKAKQAAATWAEQQVAAQQQQQQQQAAAGIDPATGLPAAGVPGADPAAMPPGAPPVQPEPGAIPGEHAAAGSKGKPKKNPVMGDDYKGTSSRRSKDASRSRAASDGAAGGSRYHIKRGDTLWALSRRFGVSIDDIVRANPKIKDPDLIYAGDTIRIPERDAA